MIIYNYEAVTGSDVCRTHSILVYVPICLVFISKLQLEFRYYTTILYYVFTSYLC